MEILKNVQTILGILFEHIEYVMLFITAILTVFTIFLNVFISNKYISQIDKNTNQKEDIKNIVGRKKLIK